ncbi:hypothetical protein K435DRAFT_148642 [Dendrothele bispora CBS 962.96]|uniref:MARVEL domain-containing protein n=1 Tax=Dendrothele bispora (strain CBS 962.96) TaxID=1314807 RepID=A0A4S8MQ62_DENBC|nr:hypothetical protein K435DRAFT_148642 [Dendrothele bispora CBS 962.96]
MLPIYYTSHKRTLIWKRRRMSHIRARYHPFLFAMMALSAMAELGLSAFLVSKGNEQKIWPSARYHVLLIMFLFNASWTVLFSTVYLLYMVDGASHLLADMASSVAWLVVTITLWGTATGLMHHTRSGGNCANLPTLSECRQSLTVEALGWTELGLCSLNLLLTCAWIFTTRNKMGDSRRMV